MKRLFLVSAVAWMLGVACSSAMAAEPSIHLDSPLDYQVFQRQTKLLGEVLLKGTISDGEGTLQYRWIDKAADDKEIPTAWNPVDVDAQMHTFHSTFKAPAGGWRRLELRLQRGGADTISATASAEHVGVGEVFVVAGQSNSTNYGSEMQRPASGRVASFDGTKWAIADDPQTGVFDRSKGGSFIPAFGDAMVKKYGVPIGVASTGAGATSVRQWLMNGEKIAVHPTLDKFIKTIGPGEWECTGELFDHFMKRVESLGPHGFRAVLWHQGESDAGQTRAGYPADRQITGKQYRELLEKIIRATRTQAGWEIPWLTAQATYHSEADPADEEFRAAQKSLWDDHIALQGPDTDSLRKDYRTGVHFNPKGLKAHGELWAKQVGIYLDKVLDQKP